MDVYHLHKIVQVESLFDWINLRSKAGQSALLQKMGRWNTDNKTLESLSYQFASVQSALERHPTSVQSIMETIENINKLENDLETIINSNSELEKESVSELLFLNEYLMPLNFIPFLLTIWSYIRVYIFPGLAILTPILMLVLPYILLRFVFKISMNMDTYFGMIACLFTGDVKSLMDPSKQSSFSITAILEGFMKMLMESPGQAITKVTGVGITVGQSVFQPYLTYKHLSAVNSLISKNTDALVSLKTNYEKLTELLKSLNINLYTDPIPSVFTNREHVAHAMLDSVPYKLAIKYVGQIEALFKLAIKQECIPVNWNNSDKTTLILKDTFDIHIEKSNRKTITIQLSEDKKQHSLLTGPNRGGKSTVLRAVCLSVLLAHTYGCSIGSYARISPFTYMYANLKADDIPGSKSHFEREVDFTAQTLLPSERTIVIVDELFHTTNPPDALQACRLYCKQLWTRKNIVSIISTHIFDLVEDSPDELVQRICCPAKQCPNGTVEYMYGLEPGICKISSVFEILEKYGYKTALDMSLKKSDDGQK